MNNKDKYLNLSENETVISEFGKGVMYQRHTGKGQIMDVLSLRHREVIQSMEKFELKNTNVNNVMEPHNIVLTDRRIVFLDKKERSFVEIVVGLEELKSRLRSARQEYHENKKLFSMVDIYWISDASLDRTFTGRDEIALSIGVFPVSRMDSLVKSRGFSLEKTTGWAEMGKNLIFRFIGDNGNNRFFIALNERNRVSEFVDNILPKLDGVREYGGNKEELVRDFVGTD